MGTEHKKTSISKSSVFKKTSAGKVLLKFVEERKGKSLKDLKGKISFMEDYDYKSLRKSS